MSPHQVAAQEHISWRLEALADLLKAAAENNDDNVLFSKTCDPIRRDLLDNTANSKVAPLSILPNEPQEWDDDIQRLVQQLQVCLVETPEKQVGDYLEDSQSARVTYQPTTTTTKRRNASSSPRKRNSQQQQQPPPQEDEEEDASEMSYPKIGPGYSDTISVCSDLTIPTVVTNLHVTEEEYYKDVVIPGATNAAPTTMQRAAMHPHHGQVNSHRQPSIGSNMMKAPPDHRGQVHDESSTIAPPSIAAPPSLADPMPTTRTASVVQHTHVPSSSTLRAPSRRAFMHDNSRSTPTTTNGTTAAPAYLRASIGSGSGGGGAAAQRRQTHQAVLAHLQRQTKSTATSASVAAGRNANRGTVTATTSTSTNALPIVAPRHPPSPQLTINDLPPLNYPNDESSEYRAQKPTTHSIKRRSLLRKSNKYAASVASVTSTRMLLSQKHKEQIASTNSNKRTSTLMGRIKRDDVGHSKESSHEKVDLDGVFSTMNGDIDFIFTELSVLENAAPEPETSERVATTTGGAAAAANGNKEEEEDSIDDSNIGATAKIKYTLTSVARTLRYKESDQQENTKKGGDDVDSTPSSDPLLIDEDGFIVSNPGGSNGNGNGDPFADSFFPTVKHEPSTSSSQSKRKAQRRRSKMSAGAGVAPDKETKLPAMASTISPGSNESKESRIDAVEVATKKRIEMLRKLVEQRAKHVSEDSYKSHDLDELQKLDYVESETMKQIARLRERMGASRRELGQE